jgi:hypothetical protein
MMNFGLDNREYLIACDSADNSTNPTAQEGVVSYSGSALQKGSIYS